MDREIIFLMLNKLIEYSVNPAKAFLTRENIKNANRLPLNEGALTILFEDNSFWEKAEEIYENNQEARELTIDEITLIDLNRVSYKELVKFYGFTAEEVLYLNFRNTFILEGILFSVLAEVRSELELKLNTQLEQDEISEENWLAIMSEPLSITHMRDDLLNLLLSFLKKENLLTSLIEEDIHIENTLSETLEMFSKSPLNLLSLNIILTKQELQEIVNRTEDSDQKTLCEKILHDFDYLSKKIEKTPPTDEECDFIVKFIKTSKQLCLDLSAENIAEYNSLKDEASGKGSFWKIIGGLVLTTLSLLVMITSITIGITSLGAATPLSALGITIAMDLMVIGSAALGATVSASSAVAGVFLAKSGTDMGFFKRIEETSKLAQNFDLDHDVSSLRAILF